MKVNRFRAQAVNLLPPAHKFPEVRFVGDLRQLNDRSNTNQQTVKSLNF